MKPQGRSLSAWGEVREPNPACLCIGREREKQRGGKSSFRTVGKTDFRTVSVSDIPGDGQPQPRTMTVPGP